MAIRSFLYTSAFWSTLRRNQYSLSFLVIRLGHHGRHQPSENIGPYNLQHHVSKKFDSLPRNLLKVKIKERSDILLSVDSAHGQISLKDLTAGQPVASPTSSTFEKVEESENGETINQKHSDESLQNGNSLDLSPSDK